MSGSMTDGERRIFSVSLNLAGIDPQKVRVSVVDGNLTVSGDQMQKVKEPFGLSRYNYCGFSNDLPLDTDLDIKTLKATIIDEKVITIDAFYYPDPSLAGSRGGEETPVERKIPVFLKYTASHSNSGRTFDFIWTPCVFPVPGSQCDGEPNPTVHRCQHSLPGTICTDILPFPPESPRKQTPSSSTI